MLAFLQRVITLTLLASACGWLLYFGRHFPVLAGAGLVAIVLATRRFLRPN